MPVDPTTDPEFMKAAPHDQLTYLSQTDPNFAKASPQDQLGYLMHIRGLSPSIASPGASRYTPEGAPNSSATPPMTPSYTDIGLKGGTTGEGIRNPMQPAERFALENPDQQGTLLGAAAIGAGGAAFGSGGAISAAAGPVMNGLKSMASGAIKAAPYVAASEAINYARQQLPGGKYIPPGAEMIPLFMSGGKEEPASEPTAKTPPISWPQAMEPQQTATAPPPIKWGQPESVPRRLCSSGEMGTNSRSACGCSSCGSLATSHGATADGYCSAPDSVGRQGSRASLGGHQDSSSGVSLSGANIPAGRSQGSSRTNASIPPMQSVQSTTVQAHGYNPATQEMFIQFKNGKTYRYSGVPQKVFDQYQSAESQGSFHADNEGGQI